MVLIWPEKIRSFAGEGGGGVGEGGVIRILAGVQFESYSLFLPPPRPLPGQGEASLFSPSAL